MSYLEAGFRNLPKGPSIDTVGLEERAEPRPFFGICGGMMVKFTSGGIDRGAFPIWDSLVAVPENARAGMVWNAGSKKEGIETDGDEAIALSMYRSLFMESIARTLIERFQARTLLYGVNFLF
jgi:hypothetical protein